ncbi:MAG TPA: glycosyltransferase family A protein [archaeon]|nr:glycosyltransferase family A protein [archaeon]
MAKISVVIGTLGRIELLRGTLESLVAQHFNAKDFEIVIVTSGPGRVRELVKSISKPKGLRIRLIFCAFKWVAPKRNIGIRFAKNPVVAFIDDDCIADTEWLLAISGQFDRQSNIAGLEGKTEKTANGLFEHATENISGGLYPTCNLAMRKKILGRICGFDETYTYHREDTDLAFKAIPFGPIPFCQDMKVFHSTRATPWKSVIMEILWVRGDIRLYKKFPGQYKKSFGLPARGAIKQGLLAWALLIAGITGLLFNSILTILSALAFVLFSFWAVLAKRTWRVHEAVVYIILTFVRDILFIPSFIYYWAIITGKENPADNTGWNNAHALHVEEY